MKAMVWQRRKLGAKFEDRPKFRLTAEKAAEYRAKMIEMAVEMDDAAMERLPRRAKKPTDRTLKSCIRKGTIAFKFDPDICGSAFKNKGVQPMLDAVVDYLPSPLDIPPVKGKKVDQRSDTDGETTREAR
jgi:elongation factor G